jgi:hypothetical protein
LSSCPYLSRYHTEFLGAGVTKNCDKDEDKMPKYLERRNARYYVRIVAPRAVQPFLDKAEWVFRKSTGTGDLKQAKVIAAELVAKKQREWLLLGRPVPSDEVLDDVSLTESLIQQIAGARLHSWIATDNNARFGPHGLNNEELAKIEKFCKHSDVIMRSILAQGRGASSWSDVVEEVLDWCYTLGYDVDTSDERFPELMRAYAAAERKAHEFISARNSGEDPAQDSALSKTGARLSEMVERYEKHKHQTVTRKTLSKSVFIWKRLIAFKGDIFLDDVNSGDIYDFFEARLKGKDGCKSWGQSYVEKHARRALVEFFLLAKTLSLMRGKGPMKELEVMPKLPKGMEKEHRKPRFPYSDEQINTVFTSQWYNSSSGHFRGKMATDLGARYFGPLLGLLHGVRVTESMQICVNDVHMIDGVLCITFQTEIEDEEEEGEDENAHRGPKRAKKQEKMIFPERTVKNISVLRTIPVHPKLLELGFDAYVLERKQQSGVGAPLFPSAVPDEGGVAPQWGRAYQQAFLRYVRDKLDFGNGYGNHSFRHQFEDRIRDAQAEEIWPAGLGQLLSGRKIPRDVDRSFFRLEGSERYYGKGYKVNAVLQYQKRLNFEKIIFPPPFGEWIKLRK